MCLVRVKIRMWHGKTQKSQLARAGATAIEAQTGKHIDQGMVSGTTVHLVDKKRIDVLEQFGNSTRALWRNRTAPWRDDGTRICLNRAILKLKGELQAARNLYLQDMVPAFLQEYPDLKRQAMYSLGPLYDPNDYPHDIARCFGFDIMVEEIPSTEDFRLQGVSQGELDDWLQATERSTQDTFIAAQADAWRRLLEPLDTMAKTLTTYDPNATGKGGRKLKGFEQSLIDNVVKAADIISDVNLFDDPRLSDIAEAAKLLVSRYTASELKEDGDVRSEAVQVASSLVERINAEADALIEGMGQFY